MKKVVLIAMIAVFAMMINIPFVMADENQSEDMMPSYQAEEPLLGVLRSVMIKPYAIILQGPDRKVTWKPIYTKFFDLDNKRLSGGQFLNQYRDRGIGVWLDEEGIAKFVRPLDF